MSIIKAKYTSIVIPNYNLGDNTYLERTLSVWNESYHRLDPIGYEYREDTKELLLPRGLDLSYLEKAFRIPVEVDFKPDPYDTASYKLKKEPRSDVQRKSISYLLGEGDFAYTKKYSQLALTLDTGDGKTYCVIAALTFMNTKALVMTHKDKIKKQWISSFLEMTNLDERYICNITGSDDINKLMIRDDWKFKVYLVNHQTIQQYAKKYGWTKVSEFFAKIKIGVKVFDEAHLEFENLMKIDLYTNTKRTFYLTANFERSDYKENKVFNLCFKNIARFGVETKHDKRKHIVYLGVLFNSKPNVDVQGSLIGLHGFDKNKYIDYEIRQQIFYDTLLYVLAYFKTKEGKTLILSPKIDSSEIIKDYLKHIFEDKKIGSYHSNLTDEEKAKSECCDIISSTFKSFGTGDDIKGLRVVINAEPYASKITANQASGRLREFGPTDYTFYVELVDVGFRKVYEMYKSRLKVFKEKCVKILEVKYNKGG